MTPSKLNFTVARKEYSSSELSAAEVYNDSYLCQK